MSSLVKKFYRLNKQGDNTSAIHELFKDLFQKPKWHTTTQKWTRIFPDKSNNLNHVDSCFKINGYISCDTKDLRGGSTVLVKKEIKLYF